MIEEKEREEPGSFGPGGAYAQAFGLFNCSMAAATLFGPVFAGWLAEQYGWKIMSLALGIFAFSGAIPAVSLDTKLLWISTESNNCVVLFDRWLDVPLRQGAGTRRYGL